MLKAFGRALILIAMAPLVYSGWQVYTGFNAARAEDSNLQLLHYLINEGGMAFRYAVVSPPLIAAGVMCLAISSHLTKQRLAMMPPEPPPPPPEEPVRPTKKKKKKRW